MTTTASTAPPPERVWFTRRYPTPLERLRYIRRVMKRPLSRPLGGGG